MHYSKYILTYMSMYGECDAGLATIFATAWNSEDIDSDALIFLFP